MPEMNDRRAFASHPDFAALTAAIETAETTGYTPPFARRVERLARSVGKAHNVDHEVILRSAKAKVLGHYSDASLQATRGVRGGARQPAAGPEHHPGYPDGLPPYMPPMPRAWRR